MPTSTCCSRKILGGGVKWVTRKPKPNLTRPSLFGLVRSTGYGLCLLCTQSRVMPLFKNVIHEDCYALNPIYTSPDLPKEKVKETILIQHLNSNSITDMKEIGQGFFGKVYKGTPSISVISLSYGYYYYYFCLRRVCGRFRTQAIGSMNPPKNVFGGKYFRVCARKTRERVNVSRITSVRLVFTRKINTNDVLFRTIFSVFVFF